MVQIYHLLYSPKLDKLFGLTDVEGRVDWNYPCRQINELSAQQHEIANLVNDVRVATPFNAFVIESIASNGIYRAANLFLNRFNPDRSIYEDVSLAEVSPNTAENLAQMKARPYRMALEEFCRGFYEHASRDDRFIVVNSSVGPRFRAEFHRVFGTFTVRIHQ